MKLRRTKPYVCVDVDFADHARFQETADLDVAAGAWLRCLAHSRAQEQDGLVKHAWIRRAFSATPHRIDELVAVGLLVRRADGDYDIHAYAPRNQTRAMIAEERESARERMAALRAAAAERRAVTANNRRTNAERTANNTRTSAEQAANERRTIPNTITDDVATGIATPGSLPTQENGSPHSEEAEGSLRAPETLSSLAAPSPENSNSTEDFDAAVGEEPSGSPDPVTANNHRTNDEQSANERRTNAFVPTSTSINSSLSSSDSSILSLEALSVESVRAPPRALVPAYAERSPLPRSERSLSGSFWLSSFSEGIAEGTGRACTVGPVYLGTLERIVTHHALDRDAPRASAWLKGQAKAFAAQWDGKHPAKGLTPDGLERWLNEGRQGPPVFGRPRLVQPPADQWHEDDWSDLGAKVDN